MAARNPIGRIKDAVVGSAKLPLTAAGSAVGLAREAAGKAGGAVSALTGGRVEAADPAPQRAAEEERTAVSQDEAPSLPPERIKESARKPVNVTEELGLDPSPVAKPKRSGRSKPAKPTTAIDAAADPSGVDVTPADVAEQAARPDA